MPFRYAWFAALLLTALSFGLSFCHVMELPARLAWAPRLWLDATTFGGLYAAFGRVGAAIDVAAILAAALLTVLLRWHGRRWAPVMAGALLLMAALAAWFAAVAPMNAIMAGWTPDTVPPDFIAVRNRWEFGHVGVATLKLAALCVLLHSALPRPAVTAVGRG